MVIGDIMVDSYLWGKVDRISPEAPVPIVSVHKRESRLGGAANVAINLRAMGAVPILCSVTGNDRSGKELHALMQELGLSTNGLISSDERVTTVKTRVIGNNHQLLRIDDEIISDLSEKEESDLTERIKNLIRNEKPAVVIFEDYDKGVLSESLINEITTLCNSLNIPTAADPKKKNFNSYRNISLFKPNLHELKAGLKSDFSTVTAEILEKETREFRKQQQIGTLIVTLSEAGIFYCNDEGFEIIPAHIRNISDVSGAGDTVISVAALCLAARLPSSQVATLANLAGGLVCEKVGVVPVDKNQLLDEALQLAL